MKTHKLIRKLYEAITAKDVDKERKIWFKILKKSMKKGKKKRETVAVR
jgi:hypothetical protein